MVFFSVIIPVFLLAIGMISLEWNAAYGPQSTQIPYVRWMNRVGPTRSPNGSRVYADNVNMPPDYTFKLNATHLGSNLIVNVTAFRPVMNDNIKQRFQAAGHDYNKLLDDVFVVCVGSYNSMRTYTILLQLYVYL